MFKQYYRISREPKWLVANDYPFVRMYYYTFSWRVTIIPGIGTNKCIFLYESILNGKIYSQWVFRSILKKVCKHPYSKVNKYLWKPGSRQARAFQEGFRFYHFFLNILCASYITSSVCYCIIRRNNRSSTLLLFRWI